MSIDLTAKQQSAIEHAIQSGLVRSVDEFIGSALGALSVEATTFDKEKAGLAGARIRELRQGVRLNREGLTLRQLAHVGHRY